MLALRKNYNILEDERPSKAFLNLENAKKGFNEVILLNKDNPKYSNVYQGQMSLGFVG